MNYTTAPTASGKVFEFKSNAKRIPTAAVIELDTRTGEEVLFSKAASSANATKTAKQYASMHERAVPTPFLRYSIVAVRPA